MTRDARSDRHLVLAQVTGSDAKVLSGVASTLAMTHGNRKAWFPNDGTIVLGAGDNSKNLATLVEWQLEFKPALKNDLEGSFLIVACERTQGGLHTQRYGALATVRINGHVRDVIGLKDIPAGHTDYFHRPPLPRLPEFWPVSGCGTVYAWPVHREHLRSKGNQTVSIEIEDDVRWDIDYVVLCRTVRPTKEPERESSTSENDEVFPSDDTFYVTTIPKGKLPNDMPASKVDAEALHRSEAYELIIDEGTWRLWSCYKDKPINIRRLSIEQRFLLWYALSHPGTIIEQANFIKDELPSNVHLSMQNIHQVLHRLKKNLGGDLRDRMIRIDRKGDLFFADSGLSYCWIRTDPDLLQSRLRWDIHGMA